MHKAFLAVVAAGLLAIGAAGVSAQTIDFNSLPIPTVWGNPADPPGTVVYMQDNINVSVELFSTGGFNMAEVVGGGSPFSPNGTQALNTNNINMLFDFSALSPVALVQFEYVDLGGIENFSINGLPVQVVPDFGAIAAPAGFTVNVGPNTVLVEQAGATPISSLLVGGQELGIDNITVRTREEPPPAPSNFAYSVKFLCGAADADPGSIPIVQPGFYATEINIHNYRPEERVEIEKEVLIMVEDGVAVGREPNFVQVVGNDAIVLDPNTATMDDCVRIAEITGVDVSTLTIGYLVLRSSQAINVDAVYTTTDFQGGQFSPGMDVERVRGDEF